MLEVAATTKGLELQNFAAAKRPFAASRNLVQNSLCNFILQLQLETGICFLDTNSTLRGSKHS